MASRYDLLVERLLAANRGEEAEAWIYKGIAATEKANSEPAFTLRKQLLNRKICLKDWNAAITLQVEEFVYDPYLALFKKCKK